MDHGQTSVHRCRRDALRWNEDADDASWRPVQNYEEVCMYICLTLTITHVNFRALHTHLQPKIVQSYAPVLMRSARQHILDILDSPERHQDHAKRYLSLLWNKATCLTKR
jgi:hypothetical protein